MNLVIVESPAKARTLKKFLGKKYEVVASMGHVIDLPKSQFGIEVDKKYKPKYITIRGKGEVLQNLKKESKKADKVFFAADPDREGEAISWHLMKALGIEEEEPCRVEFHEITKNAVKEAFKEPRNIDKNRVNAQQARRVLDRLVGYNISPLLWRKIKKKGLSAGRVQSVAIRLICDREKDIKSFKPEEYWSLTAELTPGQKKELFQAKFRGKEKGKIKLPHEKKVKEIMEELKDVSYSVKSVKKREGKRNPAPPFITSSLQQDAAKRLGFTVRKTMSLAQQLYEGINIKKEGTVGLITYIRTDSTQVSATARGEAKKYILDEFGEKYYPSKERIFKSRKGAQEAHEAIRPTSVFRSPQKIKDQLKRDQYRLYKLIWDRFVASQMSSAIFDRVTVDVKGGNYIFRASGSTIKFPGYLLLYNYPQEEKEEDAKLPELKEGQELKLIKLNPQQHFTQPPPRFTEASLVKTLEEMGIGRPSTYAPTIDTIQARGYVIKEEKNLVPTELGQIVSDLLKEYFPEIVDVEFTASMEEKLDLIEEGKTKWVEVIDRFYRPFQKTLQHAEKEMEEVEIQDQESEEVCEKCGRKMVYKFGRFGKFLACPGFPECRNTKPLLKETGVKCPLCQGDIVEKKTKKGRRFFGCSNYPPCEFVSWYRPVNEYCPQCGSILVEKKGRQRGVLECYNKECSFKKGEKNKKKESR